MYGQLVLSFRIINIEEKHGRLVNFDPTGKDSETMDSNRDPAWTSNTLSMPGDAFLECHYPVIATLLFIEHVVVLLAAVVAFTSAYKASKLRPAIKRTRRRSVRPPLALPEASL